MEQQNILLQILSLFEGFIQKLSLPADLVNLSFCRKKILTSKVDEVAVLKHLSRLVEDIKLFQDKCGAKMEELEVELAKPSAKKLKIEDKREQISVSNSMDLDASLIQVKAGKSEIDRRISAFIQRKRVEVDLLNKREFCNVVEAENNNEFRCARTDAVFVHRLGQKSHIKEASYEKLNIIEVNSNSTVTQVENTSTTTEAQALGPEISTSSSSSLETRSCPGIEERLRNIETHLGYRPGRPVPCDVYKRLADLEQKVLQLEGLSPEYFKQSAYNINYGNDSRTKQTGSAQDLTLDAIDERIRNLRHTLSKEKWKQENLSDEPKGNQLKPSS